MVEKERELVGSERGGLGSDDRAKIDLIRDQTTPRISPSTLPHTSRKSVTSPSRRCGWFETDDGAGGCFSAVGIERESNDGEPPHPTNPSW